MKERPVIPGRQGAERTLRLALSVLGAALAVFLPAAGGANEADSPGVDRFGVVVMRVEAGSLAERSGLLPGDHLTSWRRAASGWANPFPAAGEVEGPSDFDEILIEQAPRGSLTLHGERQGEEASWTFPAGAAPAHLGIAVRPLLAAPILEAYEAGVREVAVARFLAGAEAWRQGAAAAFARGETEAALWLLGERARELKRGPQDEGVDHAYSEAVEAQRRAGRKVAAALTLSRWAEALWLRARWDQAQRRGAEAVAEAGPLGDRPLLAAALLFAEGETLRQGNSLAEAEERIRGALASRQAEAPGSLEEAEALYELGRILTARRKSDEAEPLLLAAALLQRRADANSLGYVRTLQALTVVYRDQNRRAEAESVALESLRRARRLGRSHDEGRALHQLYFLAAASGDPPLAQELLLEARRCFESLPTDSLVQQNLAAAMSSLAWSFTSTGDAETALRFGEGAVEFQARLHPDSVDLAQALDVLAISYLSHDPKEAARHAARAVAIKERRLPESPDLAYSLATLGWAQALAGADLEAASGHLRRSLAICPRCRGYNAIVGLAQTAELQGRYQEAYDLLERQSRLRSGRSTDSVYDATILYLLGRVERRLGKEEASRRHLCAAAAAVDRVGDRLTSGSTARSGFYSANSEYYADCLAALFRADLFAEAFGVMESSRARSFLDLVVTRDLALSELPGDLAVERAKLRSAYHSALAALAEARSSEDLAQVETLRGRLAEVRSSEEALADRFRRQSPRYASLHHPEPVGLEGARVALDAGTVLLAYAVGKGEAFLFAVRPAGESGPGLEVFQLATGAPELRELVEALRRLQSNPRSDRAELRTRSRRLYDLLIAPAEGFLTSAKRLLIAPDGPLHSLPFAALVGPGGNYLIETSPVHTVISATVYAELKKRRKGEGRAETIRVSAFGDPSYPRLSASAPDQATDLRLRSVLRRGIRLTPLPSSRREVEAMKEVYPQAEIFVGREASEERAKALPAETGIVHFAGHALLDERSPLDSSLALAIPEAPLPGQEDGLLQSWEIFEQVRLDADLVTLSACNTALGKEMGGEGLVGLSRAFLFAGARSVLASLWAIGDRSTARFMPRFYAHLRAGLPKDEALRQTQIEWLRAPKSSHPFHWAAFQLIGDYR